MRWVDLAERLSEFAYFGTLGAFAAVVGFLYRTVKYPGSASSVSALAITGLLGFYMGMLFGELLPHSLDSRDALILLAGISGGRGYDIVASASSNLLRSVLNQNQGRSPGSDPDRSDGEGKG